MDITPTEIAKRLRKRRSFVIGMIETGRLRAYDVTEPGAKYKSYRITEDALLEFQKNQQVKKVAGRSNKPGLPKVDRFV